MNTRKIFLMLSKKNKSGNESMLSYTHKIYITRKRGEIEDAANKMQFILDGIHQEFSKKITFYNAENMDKLQAMLISYKDKKKKQPQSLRRLNRPVQG